MKPEQTPSTAPQTDAGTDNAAVAYVAQELPKARKALKRTRIVGLVLVGLVGTYISYISLTLVKFFQPREAAQVASGMIMQRVASDGPVLISQVEREIPLLIRQVPDYVIQQLPVQRRDVELVLEGELKGHCVALSKQVGNQLDEQIESHHSELKGLLGHPNDRTVIRAVLPDLDQTISSFLASDADGKVVQEHITDLAAGLKEVEKHMDRLANGSNLTPEEQKARRALAVLAKAIKDKTQAPDASSPPVAKLAWQ
jgi:hypothetical protein